MSQAVGTSQPSVLWLHPSVAMIQTLVVFLEVLSFPGEPQHSQQHYIFIITKDFFSKLLAVTSVYQTWKQQTNPSNVTGYLVSQLVIQVSTTIFLLPIHSLP